MPPRSLHGQLSCFLEIFATRLILVQNERKIVEHIHIIDLKDGLTDGALEIHQTDHNVHEEWWFN